jgi:hypothetical protein
LGCHYQPFFDSIFRIAELDFGKIAFILVFAAMIYTFVVVVHLTTGKHSFQGNTLAWQKLRELAENPSQTRGAKVEAST